ncbi:MAG: hypothetical protein OEV66_00960 [Spirochaetia bacterium]|nr:hypothetical protein [Spirochaetia bacterium]
MPVLYKSKIRLLVFFFSTALLAQVQPAGKVPPKNDWKVENFQSLTENKEFSGVELIHAEEGKYLGAQKSKEGIIIFHGGIKLKINNYYILADTVKINPDTGEILAEGNLTLTDGVQTLKGSRFLYDNAIQAGVLYSLEGKLNQENPGKKTTTGASLEQESLKPLYLMGDYTKISSMENFLISAAFLTSCEAENPHYYIKAQKIWIQPDNRFVILGAIYYAGGIPVFYFPFIFETDFGTGIRTLFGSSTAKGFYLQNSFFYGFSRSAILPESSILMFDFYQYDGLYLGTFLHKKTSDLGYGISLGIASHMGKMITKTGEGSSNSGQIITNNIINPDGSIEHLPLEYEINAEINKSWNQSFQKDAKSQIKINFQQYSSNDFEVFFKNRKIPMNTLDSIALQNDPASLIGVRDRLDWSAIYSEDWLDNHFTLAVSKLWKWNILPQIKNSFGYYPDSDVFPGITFSKSFYVVKPAGAMFQGIQNRTDLSTGISHVYSNTPTKEQYLNNDNIFHTVNSLNITNGFYAFFPLHNLLNFQPSVGYGITTTSYNAETPVETKENAIKSYQYVYSQNSLLLGPTFFRSSINYSLRYATVQKIPDPYFGAFRENKISMSISSDLAPYGVISLGTARDMRQFPGKSSEIDHWDPVSANVDFDVDFINNDNLFFPAASRPDNFFFGMGAGDTFYYNIRYNAPGQNIFDLYLQAGGYQFFFLDRIQKIRAGIAWSHDFLNYNNTNFRLYLEASVYLFKYWQLSFSISGLAYKLGTQNKPYLNLSNILNFEKTPFYLDQMSLSLEHDIHDLTIQLSYALKQSWIPFYIIAGNYTNYAGFYESQILLVFSLKGFKGNNSWSNPISSNDNPRQKPGNYGLSQ